MDTTRGSRLAQILKRLRQPASDQDRQQAQTELDTATREARPPHRTAERRPKQKAEQR